MASGNSKAASVDDAIFAIRAYARVRGWTKSRVAVEAGLADTSLRQFWLDTWQPRPDMLRVLHALIPPDFDPYTVDLPPPVEKLSRRSRHSVNGRNTY